MYFLTDIDYLWLRFLLQVRRNGKVIQNINGFITAYAKIPAFNNGIDRSLVLTGKNAYATASARAYRC